MVSVKKSETNNRISVKSTKETNVFGIKDNLSEFYAKQAEKWATSEDIVNGVDYSSKYYAEQSKAFWGDVEVTKNDVQNLVTGFDSKVEESLTNIENETFSTINNINTNKTNAISEINSTKTSAVDEITTAETGAINAINTNKNTAINEINSAGKSYDNLTHKQITNCLLEVPQNIKLELNNGVLTLKAGSVVIVPNGFEADRTTPKFDYVDITSDRRLNISVGSTSSKYVYVIQDNVNSRYFNTIQCFSGVTAPTGGSYLLWYDTTNNLIKESQDGGATWLDRKFSFPVCLFSANGNQFTSIDQVFNGFGYIGSTVWVDKGVKGLIPNGRNEDGTLKNIEFTTQKIRTYTNADGVSGEYYIQLSETGMGRANKSFWKHYAQENLNKGDDGADLGRALVGSMTLTNNVISNFQSIQPFRAVDYADYKPAIDNKVSKSGDTMTGTLSFNKKGTQILVQTDEFDQGVAVDSNKYCGIQFNDKNGNRFGKVEGHYLTDGTVKFGINAHRNVNGTACYASVYTWVDANGGLNCSFPMCTSKATTTSSATTSKVAVVVENYVNGTSWYRVWSDGWKEQGGRTGGISANDKTTTVSLAKSFSNTNYTISINGYDTQGCDTGGDICIKGIATNNFQIYNKGYYSCRNGISWHACGY